MKTSALKRFVCMAAVSAACVLPAGLCCRRLDTARVPQALAQYAVPAYRYELTTAVYTDPQCPPPGLVSYALACYDPWDRVLLTATEEGVSRRCAYSVTGRLLWENTPMLGADCGKRYTYDRRGRLLRTVEDYGVSRTETDYVWNADGTGASTATTRLASGGSLVEHGTLDAEGRVVALDSEGLGGRSKAVYAFDERGNLVRAGTEIEGTPRTVRQIAYDYDADGNIRSAEHSEDGTVVLTERAVYQDGRLAETVQEAPREGRQTHTVYEDATLR